RQIEQYRETGSYDIPTERDRYNMMRAYYSRLIERGEHSLVGKMKQFATSFTHGVRNGARLRKEIHLSREVGEIMDRMDRFFAAEFDSLPV
ncbi:MAG: tRNA-dihydrouridine synthase, partial [Bryobacteraceae bacterium]